jgi:hypothetical protein
MTSALSYKNIANEEFKEFLKNEVELDEATI